MTKCVRELPQRIVKVPKCKKKAKNILTDTIKCVIIRINHNFLWLENVLKRECLR